MTLSFWPHQIVTFDLRWGLFAVTGEAAGLTIRTSKAEAMVLSWKEWIAHSVLGRVAASRGGVQASWGLILQGSEEEKQSGRLVGVTTAVSRGEEGAGECSNPHFWSQAVTDRIRQKYKWLK